MKHFIRAQAQIAFSKMADSSCLELEDLVAIGNQILEKAKATWNPDSNARFNTYLTVLLKRDFYKVVRDSYANQWFRVEKTLPSGEVVKEKVFVQKVSIDEKKDDAPVWELESHSDVDPDYQILVDQVAKHLDGDCKRVYKQMVDPDPALLKMAADRVDPNKNPEKRDSKCTIPTEMVAAYLGISRERLNDCKARIKTVVAKMLM